MLRRLSLFIKYLVVIVLTLVVLFPVYVMVVTSLKTRAQAFNDPPVWLFNPHWENYLYVLRSLNFMRYFINSVVIAVVATFLSVATGALAAYALARFKFMGKGVFSMSTLFLRTIAPAVLVIPTFVLWNRIGLVNKRLGLIIIYVALNLPFNIWLLRTFIAKLPVELEEAALIDGYNEAGIFFRIIIPLIAPGLSVASIFTFRLAWNEFALSLVLTNRYTRTLPVAVSLYISEVGIDWSHITAISTIIAIPAFVFSFVAVKNLIMGLTAGSIKG